MVIPKNWIAIPKKLNGYSQKWIGYSQQLNQNGIKSSGIEKIRWIKIPWPAWMCQEWIQTAPKWWIWSQEITLERGKIPPLKNLECCAVFPEFFSHFGFLHPRWTKFSTPTSRRESGTTTMTWTSKISWILCRKRFGWEKGEVFQGMVNPMPHFPWICSYSHPWGVFLGYLHLVGFSMGFLARFCLPELSPGGFFWELSWDLCAWLLLGLDCTRIFPFLSLGRKSLAGIF